MNARPKPDILKISETAICQIHKLIEKRRKHTVGIKVGVKSRGCSGLSYTIEYVDTISPMDDMVEAQGIKVFIDPKAVMFLIGCEMTYEETDLHSGFVFKNPNEKGRCGCGESFHV